MKRLLLTILCLSTLLPLQARDEIISHRLSTALGNLPDNNIRSIRQDSLGYLYFQSIYNLYRYDGYTFLRLTAMQAARTDSLLGKPHKSVTTGTGRDNRGNPFSIDRSGMMTYEDTQTGRGMRLKVFDPQLLTHTDNLKCRVVTDRRGLIWVSVNGGGLVVHNPKTDETRYITDSDPTRLIDNNQIVFLTEDRDGHIWVSMEHYGVACLSVVQQDYELVDLNGAADNRDNIRMMHRTPDGRILIADNYGTLYLSDGLLQNVRRVQNDGSKYITAHIDPQGQLWLGGRLHGVYKADFSANGQMEVTPVHGDYGRVDNIATDAKGRRWYCGIHSNLAMTDSTSEERHFFSHISQLHPRAIATDKNGRMWLGTARGLFDFHTDSLLADSTRYRIVTPHAVRTLLLDSSQRLWIGTEGQGLLLFSDGRLVKVEALGQLGIIQAIVEDRDGRLCVSTENGLSVYDPEQKRIVRTLFFTDALVRNFYNEGSSVLLDDGRMALGTLDGIVITPTTSVSGSTTSASLRLTTLTVNGAEQNPDSLLAGQVLTLDYDQNSLTLGFSHFAFGQAQNTVYSFLLEGYDHDWCTPAQQNTTAYKNLKPGNYTLRVRCRVGNEDWTESTYTIHITPPWWRTWWAYLAYAMVAFVLGYTLYRHLRYLLQLRQAVAVEKQLTEYKLKFFTNISHEFRTPLTLIQGSMDKLKALPDAPSSARAPLSNMQRNVDRMLRLVNQLLEFRRMQNNKLSLSLEETDVVAFVHNICQGFHDTAEQKRISLSFLPSAKSHLAYIDRGFVDKAVYNLLSNAFKYTPSGGSINVNLQFDDLRFTISVADTGVGVPENMREKIFDRFQRGQIGRDSLGIGLDLTAELIRTHHGTIRCGENPGGGSIFTIELPTDKGVYEEKDFLRTDAPDQEKQSDVRRGFTEPVRETMNVMPMNDHRILVVEDDAEIAAFLQQELGRYFQVDTAADGEEALTVLSNHSPLLGRGAGGEALVITDAMMPRMNGFELLRRLRRDQRTRHLPVIMLTALDSEDQQMKGLEVGADAYITKPFSMPLLLMQVRNLLQRSDDIRKASTPPDTPTDSTPTDPAARQKRALAAAQVIVDERDKRLLAQLAVWVDAHLAAPDLSVDKFAEGMGYGRTSFYNKLKALTGQTPNEYIKEQRLQRAYELLSDEHVTVAEVAYQVGMATPQYLSTTFKKRFGITPTQFQKGH